MFKSLRWNLMGWLAVILVAVVTGFGATLYLQVRYATFERVDADLLGAAQVVAERLSKGGRPERLDIPEAYRGRFGAAEADAPYLVVWDPDGRELIASERAPRDIRRPSPQPARDRRYEVQSRGPFREAIVHGPSGYLVLAGREMGRERNELTRLLGWLLAAGFSVLAVGLGAGWLLSRRILAPLERMSRTAERISASNLSERIDLSGIKIELGTLGVVLNSMFDRLQASFDRQIRFTADASHELRTPVSVVLAQTELALARRRSADEYEEALAACQRAAKRMESLVDGLMTLARIDAGQLEIGCERVDLRQIVENSVALLKPLADQKQVRLTCDLQSVEVAGDTPRLGQVVSNLLGNAIAYSHEGCEVSLRLAAERGEAVLSVTDTGIGIDAADLPHVFERFYRADKSRSGASGGVGLGLAICQEIVSSHGGTIAVVSKLGKGATFTVRLPRFKGD